MEASIRFVNQRSMNPTTRKESFETISQLYHLVGVNKHVYLPANKSIRIVIIDRKYLKWVEVEVTFFSLFSHARKVVVAKQ